MTVGELLNDLDHATAEAKGYVPDYPWPIELPPPASELVWALGQSIVGLWAANADLHERISQLESELREAKR